MLGSNNGNKCFRLLFSHYGAACYFFFSFWNEEEKITFHFLLCCICMQGWHLRLTWGVYSSLWSSLPLFFFIFKDGQVQYFFWCHPQNFVPGHCIFRRKRSKSKRHFIVIQSRRPFQKAFSYRRHIQERKEKNGDKNRHFPRVECLAFFSCFRSSPKFFSISIPRI